MSELTFPRILIVEDEAITARDLQHCLKSLGYQVCGMAINATEAVDCATEIKPDLVLMDIRLQGEMDGIEAAGIIYEQLGIPVVFLTAFADEETVAKATRTLPFGYLTKPFEIATLKTTVQVALTRSRHEQRMQRELATSETLHSKAKELNEARSRYLALISHEFRTPLSAIMLSSTILEKYSKGWTEEKKVKHLQRITTAVTDLNQLLKEMVAIKETGTFELTLTPQPLDLVAFSQNLVEQLQPIHLPEPQIQLIIQGTPSIIYLDRNLLHHVFTNLLVNALKYSPEGAPIEFRLEFREKELVWQVRDRGIGIPPESLQQLFNIFHRGANVGKIKGQGIGLALVKHCVDLHGGRIDVESEKDQGTCFTILVPIVPVPATPLFQVATEAENVQPSNVL